MNSPFIMQITEFATQIFDTIVIFMYLKGFLGAREDNRRYVKLSGVIFAILLILSNHYITNSSLKLFLVLLSVFSLSFLYAGDIKTKVFATFLFLVILVVTDTLTAMSMMTLEKATAQVALQDGPLRAKGMIASNIMLLVLTKAACLFRKRYYVQIPILYWIALLSFPLISILCVHMIFVFNDATQSNYLILSYIIILGLLYSNIIVFYLFDRILNRAELQSKSELLEQQLKNQSQHYMDLTQSQKELRKVRHDLKNHLLSIEGYLKGDKNDEAISYISGITEQLNKTSNFINTGNVPLDALLNAKCSIAKENNIKFTQTIQIPEGIHIEPIDLCILIGNALDNAIESCQRIENGERFISVMLAYESNALVGKIKNSTNGNLYRQGKLFKTTKANAAMHGIGLQNIESVVHKYNGSFHLNHENKVFELSFSLYGA